MRLLELAGVPVRQKTSPNVGGPMVDHRGLVLHMAQGSYEGTIAWQMNPGQRYADGTRVTTSSTFVVGPDRGQITQMVDTDTIAWCQRGGSLEWLSIELSGFTPSAPTEWQAEACAELLVWAHRTYGVPIRAAAHPGERGLGHHSMDREWMGEEWGHEACPGVGVVTAKRGIVERAQAIAQEGSTMATPEEIWGIEYPDYVENEEGKRPSINTKHALMSARRDAWLARVGVRDLIEKGVKVTIDYDLLADKVAERMGGLMFVPINTATDGVTTITTSMAVRESGDVLPTE